jgi:hypothetical protein
MEYPCECLRRDELGSAIGALKIEAVLRRIGWAVINDNVSM